MRELSLSAAAFLAVIAGVVSLDPNLESNQCVSGLLTPHECICTLYYQCVGGLFVERSCPDGQEFDMNQKKCVSAKDAVCYQPEDDVYCPEEGSTIIGDKNNCGVYYECNNGVQTQRTCPDGLSFNEEVAICDWPPCSDYIKKRAPSPFSLTEAEGHKGLKCPAKGHVRLAHECLPAFYYECREGVMIGKECPDGLIFNSVEQVCDYPDDGVSVSLSLPRKFDCKTTCSPNGNELIPHESDCASYYRCSRGRKKLEKCIEGRYFNCLLEACDLPENTDCADYTTIPTTTMREEGCPRCDCGIVRYPHADCSMYYECEDGVRKQKQCPSGLYYDQVRNSCTYLELANCTKPTCTDGEVTPHQCQCDRYIVCESGERVIVPCPPGKLFDADRLVCDDPDKVHCKPTKCIGTCSTSSSTENLPHEDCRKFCQCDNGVAKPADCPKNMIYDRDTKSCQFPENVKSPACDPFPCDSDTLLPHKCYCDRYLHCTNGTKILQWCEDGKNFDYETQSCVPCKKAHCFQSRVPGRLEGCKRSCAANGTVKSIEHADCDKYCTCSDCNGQTIVDCPPKRYYNPKTGACDRPENVVDLPCEPFPCAPGADGDLPHECDCTLYYRCENGKRKERHCPVGMKFDYDTLNCVQAGAHCYFKNSSTIHDLEERGARCGLARSDVPIVRDLLETVQSI